MKQTTAKRVYEQDPYNSRQNFLYKRAIFGLAVYSEQEISELRLKAEEIWTWLQQGAYLYICGDGNKMAKDVHQALLDIAQQQAGFTAEQAEQYFDDLRQAKRYQKDVY